MIFMDKWKPLSGCISNENHLKYFYSIYFYATFDKHEYNTHFSRFIL